MDGALPAVEVPEEATVVAPPSVDAQDDAASALEESDAGDRSRSSPGDEDDSRDEDGRDQSRVDEPGDLAVLKQKIIRQVEYYFSDENLPTDNHLLGLIKKNKGGFVPIRFIASFRKMKKLTDDQEFIATALKESSFLTVSTDGKKVKRLHPLPCEVRDEKLFTVLVENLPEDHSLPNLERIFGEVGKIKKICIHDPSSAEVSKKGGKIDKFLINKLHALVEYATMEAAEKAVATLHNEADWRNGMRVKLLKRAVKPGQKNAWKSPDSEKNGTGHTADGATNDQVHDASQLNDHVAVEQGKNEEGGRNQVRPRRHKHRGGTNGGSGHGTTSSSHSVDVSKPPPPGPRMPDGSRGFAMGRGRPPVPDHV